MKTKQKSIGSFDAKTHLARVLDEVQRGVEFIITKRGKPVAKLVKYKDLNEHIELPEIIRQFDKIRNSVKGKIDIKGYIAEGRKH
jgi:prevent-host-death family protein